MYHLKITLQMDTPDHCKQVLKVPLKITVGFLLEICSTNGCIANFLKFPGNYLRISSYLVKQ